MRLFSAFILFLVLFSGIAKAEETLNPTDDEGINEALKEGGIIYLNSGVYEIDGPIYIGSDTVLTGSKDAIIRVSSKSSQWFVGSTGIISSNGPVNNVLIEGFQIDGNCDELPRSYANSKPKYSHDAERAILIRGYTNKFSNNVTIRNMQIYDCFSDGIHLAYCNNADVYNNFISNCQHEGVFFICVKQGELYGNKVAGICSDCLRLDNCVDNRVYDNILFSYDGDNTNGQGKHGENGLQVGDSGVSKGYDARNKPTHTKNIEIFNNTFANNGLRAIWLDAAGQEPGNNVFVHDNHFIGADELETMGIPVDGNHVENVSYDNMPTVEQSREVFDSIFDFLELDFRDNATVTNTDVNPDIEWQEKGKSKAWVDIVGWDNLLERNGIFYIPEGQEPIVKYDAENTASRPVSLDTDLTLTEKDGILTADLKVKAVYEVAKKATKKVNGISVPSIELIRKSSTSHYIDSELIPETFRPSINATAYLTVLNNSMSSQTRVYVPDSPDVMKVLFKFNNTEIVHYLHTATLNSTEKGVKYAQVSELDYWTGENVSRLGSTLVLPGRVDPDELTVIQYDVYGNEIPITDYETEVKNQDEKKLIPPITFLFSGIVGLFLIATYKVSEVFL